MKQNQFDVIVIGGGISGLTAAYTVRKKAPDARVIVLEGKGVVFFFFSSIQLADYLLERLQKCKI